MCLVVEWCVVAAECSVMCLANASTIFNQHLGIDESQPLPNPAMPVLLVKQSHHT